MSWAREDIAAASESARGWTTEIVLPEICELYDDVQEAECVPKCLRGHHRVCVRELKVETRPASC